MSSRRPVRLALVALVLSSCAAGPAVDEGSGPVATTAERDTAVTGRGPSEDDGTDSGVPQAMLLAAPRPPWLGTRPLPIAPDGFGERLPTPQELVDRQLITPPLPDPAPPSPSGEHFESTVGPVPAAVVARSTWTGRCPVTLEELRYVTVSFVGFDGAHHTGELIVHAEVAEDVVSVFAALHAARFPLEEVRVIAADELALPPTGDGNVTSAFVCRATVGGSRWSEHAYGRAIDINPFHNPYVRGDLVLPELAGAYVDRTDLRPGMVVAGDVVTRAFTAVGWGWGGDWTGSARDPMHFSVSGR